MRVAPDQTLNGYIFNDENHARLWLRQAWFTPEKLSRIRLERVEVGEFVACERCRGEGRIQSVRKIKDVDVGEFLKGCAP